MQLPPDLIEMLLIGAAPGLILGIALGASRLLAVIAATIAGAVVLINLLTLGPDGFIVNVRQFVGTIIEIHLWFALGFVSGIVVGYPVGEKIGGGRVALCVAVLLWAGVFTVPGAEANGQTWEPPPSLSNDPITEFRPAAIPAEVTGPVHVRTYVIDVSGSMDARGGLATRGRSVTVYAAQSAEPGTYFIISIFGTYAEVISDRFVFHPLDRSRLFQPLDAVLKRPPQSIRAKTDIPALERVLDAVRDGIATEFQVRGYRHKMVVLTDGDHDPVDPADQHRTFDTLLGQPTMRTSLGDGLYAYTLEFEHTPVSTVHLLDTIQETEFDSLPAMGHAADTDTLHAVVDSRWASESEFWLPWLAVPLGVLLILALGYVFYTLRRSRNEGQAILKAAAGSNVESEDTTAQRPPVLLVQEYEVDEDGSKNAVQENLRLRFATDVPLTIGSDTKSVILLRSPGAPEQLATILIDESGAAVLTSLIRGLTLDGKPVLISRPERFDLGDRCVLASTGIEAHIELESEPSSDADFFRTGTDDSRAAAGNEGRAIAGRSRVRRPISTTS